MSLNPTNRTLLDRLRLFAVARPGNAAHFDLDPFGIHADHVIDPLHGDSASFLALLERLDEVSFGPEGMPMPRWVFLDGAELTGGIVGFGFAEDDAPSELSALLGAGDDYRGLVPCSMFIAIPTFEQKTWFGHNLASLASKLPDEQLGGLGSLTKAVALKMFRATSQLGATQWNSRALFVHCRLGPLELVTASTPAHGDQATLTYRARIDDNALRHLARDPAADMRYPDPDEWIRSDDRARQDALQAQIEAGERFVIAGRPQRDGAIQRVPIARIA